MGWSFLLGWTCLSQHASRGPPCVFDPWDSSSSDFSISIPTVLFQDLSQNLTLSSSPVFTLQAVANPPTIPTDRGPNLGGSSSTTLWITSESNTLFAHPAWVVFSSSILLELLPAPVCAAGWSSAGTGCLWQSAGMRFTQGRSCNWKKTQADLMQLRVVNVPPAATGIAGPVFPAQVAIKRKNN